MLNDQATHVTQHETSFKKEANVYQRYCLLKKVLGGIPLPVFDEHNT